MMRISFVAAIAAGVLMGAQAGATTITFDGLPKNNTGGGYPADFGSSAAQGIQDFNTPNVSVLWSYDPNDPNSTDQGRDTFPHDGSGWGPPLNPETGNPNVVTVFGDEHTMTFRLTPDPGYTATIESFDLTGYATANTANHGNIDWNVDGGANSPAVQAGSAYLTVNVNATSAPGTPINLNITEHQRTNSGHSNFKFSQTLIPEPTSLVLVGMGALLLLGASLSRRRK